MTDAEVVVLVSDEGLGGIVAIGDVLRGLGFVPALVTGPASDRQLAGWRDHHDEIRVVDDPYDSAVLERAVRSLPGRPRGLFSCYDGCVVPAAMAAETLGIPHCDVTGLRRSRNKFEARTVLRQAGVDRVPAVLVGASADLSAVEAELGHYPFIAKPVNGVASHLVLKCADRPELRLALRRLRDRITADMSALYVHRISLGVGEFIDPCTEFLVEPFLDGTEFSAECVVVDGQVSRIALLEKLIVDSATFFEAGYISVPESDRAERIWQFVEACLLAVGLDSAMCHVEVIDTGAGVSLVEINAGRPGGGLISSLVRASTGRDQLVETVLAALRRWAPTDGQPDLALPVGMVVSYPPGPGRLRQITGLDSCRAMPGVASVVPFLQPGAVVRPADHEVFGVMAVTSGLDADAIREVHRDMVGALRYDLEPLPD